MVKDLREGLFDIFQLVAVIKDGTYAFMAGGLQDDSQAEKAIAASNQIEGKVQEIRPADNAEVDL